MSAAGWIGRLKSGLSKSTAKRTGGIAGIVTKRKLDTAALAVVGIALMVRLAPRRPVHTARG